MSKEAEARVRDELLQSLYAAVLHTELAAARTVAPRGATVSAAVAAGVCAVLQPSDLLLLPPGRADAFRLLRGLGSGLPRRDLREGVLMLPRDEEAAAAAALGAAAALVHGEGGRIVCAVLPPRGRAPAEAEAWQKCGKEAARLGLPLLLLADAAASARVPLGKSAPLQPAPSYPSIPVDREDALAVYRVAFECAARARTGGGPSRLDCLPFRLHGKAVRAPELNALERLEHALKQRGAFPKSWQRQLERSLIAKLSS